MKGSEKYTKGKFSMSKDGVQLEGLFSPWLRFCIGLAVVLTACGFAIPRILSVWH